LQNDDKWTVRHSGQTQRDPESIVLSGLSALQQMLDTRLRGNDSKYIFCHFARGSHNS
jgi:hypothetical protein